MSSNKFPLEHGKWKVLSLCVLLHGKPPNAPTFLNFAKKMKIRQIAPTVRDKSFKKEKSAHAFPFSTRSVGVENHHVKQETCAYCEKLLLLSRVFQRRFSENCAILVETQRKLYWVLCVRGWYRRITWFWISWNLFPFDLLKLILIGKLTNCIFCSFHLL